jgi:hypothetical protein
MILASLPECREHYNGALVKSRSAPRIVSARLCGIKLRTSIF